MIQSMTGFGKATCELTDKVVNIEIKTLNSKQLDIYLRIPNAFRDQEAELRNELTNKLKRGKVEVIFTIENSEGKQATHINATVVKDYYHQLMAIAGEMGIKIQEPILQAILRLPDALNNDRELNRSCRI